MSDTTYKMVKLLGEGSYGKAYLCQSEAENVKYVIKQIIIEGMSTQEQNETLNESTILAKLDHPNIIKFKEVFIAKRPKRTINIVTEFADGGDLGQKISAQKGHLMQENEILDYFTQICLAIKHIHDKKIIHRDLKSQNVFLTKSGLVKLGDFGIAKGFKNTWDKASTVIGTPYYLSPEIVNNKPYDYKSDIWSLGVLLYEMMALKMPFDAGSLPMLSLKIMRGNYPPPPSCFSQDLRNLVSQLLATDPAKRPKVDDILKNPIIKNRISHFLSEVQYNADFSKTLVKKYKEKKKSNKTKKKHGEKKAESLAKSNKTEKAVVEQNKELMGGSGTNVSANDITNSTSNNSVKDKQSTKKNVENDKNKAMAFFKKKSQAVSVKIKKATEPAQEKKGENNDESKEEQKDEHRQELRNFLQAKKQTKKDDQKKFNESGVMWPKNKPKEFEPTVKNTNFPDPILVEKDAKGTVATRKIFNEDKITTSVDSQSLNNLIESYDDSFDVNKMNEDQYNQNRLLNNLHKIMNEDKEDSDNDGDDKAKINCTIDSTFNKDNINNGEQQLSNISSGQAKDQNYKEYVTEKIKLEDVKGNKNNNKNTEFEATFKSDTNKLEELFIELEKSMPLDLLKSAKNFVTEATDPNEMKFDNEKVINKIKTNLTGKYKQEQINLAIEKIPEIFAVVAMERAANK